MHREDRFLISRKQFAINLQSLAIEPYKIYPDDPEPRYRNVLTAVWYRRKKGTTYACVGTLSKATATPPQDVHTLLAQYTDGGHGGDCKGRWDGTRYWGAQEPEVMFEHMAILKPMLDDYPSAPTGFDAWWTFQPTLTRKETTR